MNIDVNKLVPDVGKIVDDVVSTSEERDDTLTKRLSIDTTSPFLLPHIIRPIIALVLLLMQIAIFVAVFMSIPVPVDIVVQIGALNMASIGFYFNSRKVEKIQAKNAQAAIVIAKENTKQETIKLNHQQTLERKEKRLIRRERRKALKSTT